MAVKIGAQTGIVATNSALKALDPAHAAGFDKLAATETALVANSNEYYDRIAALEAAVANLPFPLAYS